jgi:hypothetical protein
MSKEQIAHEAIAKSKVELKASDRSFGYLFAVVFAAIGVYGFWRGSETSYYFFTVAILFLSLAIIYPQCLRPLNKAWFLFGLLLHKIVNPLILGLLFYVTILPAGVIMRLLGKDLLNLKYDKDAKSYWIDREPPGPEPDSIKHQF